MKQYMETRNTDYNVIYPTNIFWLLKDKKGTQNIREIMNKGTTEKTISQAKWSDELTLHSETDWQKLYLIPKQCNANARIRFFQYQEAYCQTENYGI